ncbi:putative acetyltransferase [Sinorhizobium sp. KGO-5]|uniref:acyltransferase n=1 Tax=unclassified Sinorhizobium TaxID=2613772 RepID=UPI00294A4007|nr:putative acetyltransferase [Sinorhizobium sp. KGO-5]
MIEVHPSAKISPLCDIEGSVRGTRIVVGEASVIDSFVKIKPAGGTGDLTIGRFCYVNSGCVFYTGNGISIADNVLIAANCTFAPVNHAYGDRDRLIREQGFLPSRGGIVVEEDVWIGANSVILDGALLRKGCVIAAGSIVRGEVEAYTVCGGNPLRRLGVRS